MSWRWDDELRELDDSGLVRLARGVAQVERAVLRHRNRVGCTIFKIPTEVAIKIGWPLCSSCGRPIVPWQRITWRRGEWHPRCITAHLSEHGGGCAPGTAGRPVHAREAEAKP